MPSLDVWSKTLAKGCTSVDGHSNLLVVVSHVSSSPQHQYSYNDKG